MSDSHSTLVDRQFGPRAGDYVRSATHAGGPDLDHIERIAREHRGASVLDLGCGGGHVAYRMAPFVREVVALDLSPAMLAAVGAEAARRGLSAIRTEAGAAEALPFADATFDLLVSRFSAHHWRDLGAGLREARRVLQPGGLALFVDVVAPADPLLDTHLQTVELLRDPSHVRDYRTAEWVAALGAAGFAVVAMAGHRLPLDFAAWVGRMATPPANVDAIRSVQAGAAAPVRAAFAVAPDGSFAVDVATFECRPA